MKQNCWEFKECGREPGGSRNHEMGVCPAATMVSVDGVHGGVNGGRACWAVVGTYCGGVVQDSLALKLRNCIDCPFRVEVERDERGSVVPSRDIITLITQSR